ncbi:MAG: cell division protein FtsA [Candidatus Eutrophobiaceae bacterium]
MVGVDIGTSKVATLVATCGYDGEIEIIGCGLCRSRGMSRGVVLDIEATVNAIQQSVGEAQLMSGCKIHSVYVGIAGHHVRSFNSNGVVAIDKAVTQQDLARVMEAARAMPISGDRRLLHVLQQEFTIDGEDGIREPLNMAGRRLEANVHLVTVAGNAMQNISNCVNNCGLEVDAIVLEQLASSCAVLTEDEKNLGVCLVDIGGGTTDVAVFTNGCIRHTAAIPIAGDLATRDISGILRTSTQDAEDLKIRYAYVNAAEQPGDLEEMIDVPSMGDRPPRRLARQRLASVLEPRYEELFILVQEELRRNGFDMTALTAGVVLTGGSSRMRGAVELAEEVFHVPVRLGVPRNAQGLADIIRNPIYATGVGLLHYAREIMESPEANVRRNKPSLGATLRKWFHGATG